MASRLRPNKPYLNIQELLIALGGILLILGTFMEWLSYHYHLEDYSVIRRTGIEFGRAAGTYPEVFLLPFIGLFLIFGAFFSACRRWKLKQLNVSKWFVIGFGIITCTIGLAIPLEVAIRYSAFLFNTVGISFYNNAGLGWYTTIFGAILGYIAALLPRKLANIGATDFMTVAADTAPEEKIIPVYVPVVTMQYAYPSPPPPPQPVTAAPAAPTAQAPAPQPPTPEQQKLQQFLTKPAEKAPAEPAPTPAPQQQTNVCNVCWNQIAPPGSTICVFCASKLGKK